MSCLLPYSEQHILLIRHLIIKDIEKEKASVHFLSIQISYSKSLLHTAASIKFNGEKEPVSFSSHLVLEA